MKNLNEKMKLRIENENENVACLATNWNKFTN